MAFATNLLRHSFPHTFPTTYQLNDQNFGPAELELSHLEGDILVDNYADGVSSARRRRRSKRTFTLKYDILEEYEHYTLWYFYDTLAEHELYYFYINLYYMDFNYFDEWIAVNFSQKVSMKYFYNLLGTTGITLIENLQATLTHELPAI